MSGKVYSILLLVLFFAIFIISANILAVLKVFGVI